MPVLFKELENYCDNLERAGDVHVILHAHYSKGFSLVVSDGIAEHAVTDDQHRPYCFRTIEMALDELANIPYISEKITVNTKSWY